MRKTRDSIIWMSVFLLAVMTAALLLSGPLLAAFLANPAFNGMILFVLLVGLVVNYRQVLILNPEVRWIEAFRTSDVPEAAQLPRTRLLGAMARLLTGRRGDQFTLSTVSMRTLLDGIRMRLDESRDLSRYFIGLLVFLGLLGTFWGLLDTLRGVGAVISDMGIGGEDMNGAFAALQSGLEKPLSGLGTAFSSSLFGLAGALVLGFVDLQAGHAQNRFYNELEEWLSGLTRLSTGALVSEGEGTVPAYIQALLEQTSDSLDKLQRLMARGEDERRLTDQRLIALTQEVAEVAQLVRGEQKAMLGLARTQSELQGVLERLAEATGARSDSEQEMSRHLSGVADTLSELRVQLGEDRGHFIGVLRDEVRLMTRTAARLGEGGRERE
ncbi:flagellar motor protein MotA [Ectothiorhodospira shaposhnikovii]|uniref:flagellar motor protein MotA n=1 Tax=Ectothiorhodospira shaposhnikovii TaxID=1054 RepID=UPI001904BE95|nr:flagellar motor protein MotA [Ectothiorhodospira shaposhnikovii]MBK1674371.1 flagellar motor protein MotA [Ectothiorhodospira shaposhnikovii]